MSEKKPYFIYHKAKKQSGEPSAVFWESAISDTRALRDAENHLEDAGKDAGHYFRPVVTNFPVVDELPEEGEIDFNWCSSFQLGDDGMTWTVIPGSVRKEKVVAGTDSTIVDGVDTQTGEIVNFDAAGSADETATITIENDQVIEQNGKPITDEGIYSLPLVSFNQQLLAQFASEEKHVTEYTWEQRRALTELEMDTDNSYVQNLLLAASQHEELKKIDLPTLWKFTDAVKKVFPRDKRQELGTLLQFTKLWIDTEYIDRGILVREWAAGNRISSVQRTPSGANAGGVNHTDRLTPQTVLGLEYEIALGLLAREHEFDIYKIPLNIEILANSIMNKMDNHEFLATRDLFVSMPGGLDYSRACNIATVKTTPEGLWQDPPRHRSHLNRVMTETDHAHPDELVVDIACGRSSMPMPMAAADEDKPASNEGEKSEVETTSDVQIQETVCDEEQAGDALQSGESDSEAGEETTAVEPTAAEILAANAPHLASQEQEEASQISGTVSQNSVPVNQTEPETEEIEPEVKQWPTSFEPGRYEGVPNEVYHSANGISSTMLKDVRISPMFYCGRHVTKAIPRTQNDAMIRGTVVHSYVLEPEKFHEEFAVPAEMPNGVVSTTSDLQTIIKEYNASLPALMTPDELKGWIEAYNNDLTPPLSLSGSAEETGLLYMSLPEEFQRLPADGKQTATQQKGCIKEYNASLPPMLKTSGTRDQLLDQIATVAPDMAAAERAKFVPYNVSGTKDQLTDIVRTLRPDVMTADDWHKQQEVAATGKTMISLDMYEQAKNISAALQAHPSASRLLNHPARQSEVSYFGFDEETGLEVRVRPDIEIQLPHSRIGGDLKTISLGYVKQENLRARLHREIIDRDYHLSAAMYCDVANLDQFFWIFVCRDEGYHWIAVVEASVDELELGRLEYRRALQIINDCQMSGSWPAPITDDYTDELNDYDLRRYEALSAM